ncbi:MAG: glutamate racemase, partial [Candidatus Thiodiazotropha sp.]
MMSSSLPIGIFDSGIGGLSVLHHIRDLLPSEDLIYVSDRGNLPYGSKESRFILERSKYIVEFVIELKVNAIVIACISGSAVAVSVFRMRF